MEDFNDYPVFMAIAQGIGYDAKGRETTENTNLIQPDGKVGTLVRCGDLMDYIIDEKGMRVSATSGILGQFRELLDNPSPFPPDADRELWLKRNSQMIKPTKSEG